MVPAFKNRKSLESVRAGQSVNAHFQLSLFFIRSVDLHKCGNDSMDPLKYLKLVRSEPELIHSNYAFYLAFPES